MGGMTRSSTTTAFDPWPLPLRSLERPGDREIHAWYLDLALLGGPLGPEAGHADTRRDAMALKTLRRFYLRLLLGAYLGVPGKDIEVLRSRRGKPYLAVGQTLPDLQFNIARSSDRALVAVTATAVVGVDLEPAGRQPGNALGVARRYFSAAEADALAAMEGESRREAFMRTWACKEAVVKACGQGIANHLSRFTVDTRLDRPPSVLTSDDAVGHDWTLTMVQPEPGYLGAVAVAGDIDTVKGFRLMPPPGSGH